MGEVNWFDVVTRPQGVVQPEIPKEIPAPGDDWWRAATGQPEMRSAPVTSSTRAGGGYDRGADSPRFGFLDHMRASLAPTNKRIRRYSEMSGIPEDRFGVIDGDIVYWNGNKYVPVAAMPSEGKGLADTFGRVGEQVGAAIGPMAPSVAGAVAGGVSGPTPASIPVAGAVAGTTNLALQAIDKALAGENVFTSDYEWLPALGDAMLNSAGQGAGNLVVKMFNRNPLGVPAFDRMKALDEETINSAEKIQKFAKDEYGIDLTTGQATGLRSMLVWERNLGRWDETADDVAAFRENVITNQVPGAVRQEIRKISPLRGEEAAQSFKQGADSVVKAAEKKAVNDSEAFYKSAFDANPDISSPLINRILKTESGKSALKMTREEMNDARTLMATPDEELTQQMRVLADIDRMERVSPGVSRGLKLRTLDLIKQKLYDLEQAAKENGRATYRSRAIGKQRKQLTKELDRMDATGGDYARARAFYGEGAEQAEVLLSGPVGALKKNKSDTVRLVNTVFNDGNLTPQAVGRMRAKFYANDMSDQWNAGVARWLEGHLNEATKQYTQGMGNTPGTFYKRVWGSGEQREIVRQAIGPEKMEGFERFMMVLDRARKNLPEGSPTPTDMGRRAPDPVGEKISLGVKAVSPDTYLGLGKNIGDSVLTLREPARRIALMEQLFSKQGVTTLRKLRMLSPKSAQATKIVSDFIMKGSVGGTVASFPGRTTRSPEELKQSQISPQSP